MTAAASTKGDRRPRPDPTLFKTVKEFSMPGDPAHEPIYTVTHLDGTTTTIDLTVPVGYQDLGFTLTSKVGGRRTRATVGVYHTGEIGLFCQLLTAARTHAQPGLVDRVRREVAALTEGLEPTLDAQHRLEDGNAQWLLGRQPTGQVRYPGTAHDESLVVDTTGPLIRLTLLNADATTVTADWPAEQADSLLAGMIWRTHHQPDEPFSWLSRTPTAVYQTLLASTDESGPSRAGRNDMSIDAWPGSLHCDAHPCEGPGSNPQDLLPDDRARGSRPLPGAGSK